MDLERYKKYFYTNENNYSIDNIADFYSSGKGEKRAVNMAFNDMAARTLKKATDDEGGDGAVEKERALTYLRDSGVYRISHPFQRGQQEKIYARSLRQSAEGGQYGI